MDWTEVTVKTDRQFAEDAAAIMQMVSNGIYIEDYENLEENIKAISHVDLIDEELLLRDRDNVVIHMYIYDNPIEQIEFVKERLNSLSFPYEIQLGKIDDEDWANNWKKFYKPFEVGERLLIKPVWEEIEATDRTVLNIEPGLAFGTGTHESTKMCLELLEKYISGGMKVLDVGCGSGILAIASLLMGAKSACAIDIDPMAVKIAKQNGGLNGYDDKRLTVLEGNLVDTLRQGEKFELVLANIIADVIIMLTDSVIDYMAEGAVLICSGIIDEKLASVKAALEKRFDIIEVSEEKGWAAVAARFRG